MRSIRARLILVVMTVVVATSMLTAQPTAPSTRPAQRGRGARVDDPDNGARAIDFSYAGYKAGAEPIPDVPVRVAVKPADGDDTARIQGAIDYVSSLPDDQRGAILLTPGRFEVGGALTIGASNVVLRGSGVGENGTVLLATGFDRRTLITIKGIDDRRFDSDRISVSGDVAVGAQKLALRSVAGLKPGDTVVVRRPSTSEWIRTLSVPGDTAARWRPGSRDIVWDRTITSVDGNTIALDAPITNALESEFGGGTVTRYTWPGRISNVGVENLHCESSFDASNERDEDHAWYAVAMQNVRDGWVRRVTMSHFAGGGVWVYESCKQVTVRDCKSLAPISEIANPRRHSFLTGGTQTLFLHCHSERGRHDFAVDLSAAGPNAFVQCDAVDALDSSGPIDSWATGVLFDNVRTDNAIVLSNRGREHQFVGWCAANCMLWQCSAAVFRCASPPTARNWANGCWGTFDGNGSIRGTGEFVDPDSLYLAQLTARIRDDRANQIADWMRVPTDSYTNPPVEKAALASAEAVKPAPTVSDWIADAPNRRPIPTDPGDAKAIEEVVRPTVERPAPPKRIEIVDGKIVINGRLVAGGLSGVTYWRGSQSGEDNLAQDVKRRETSLVRFVPGRAGPGLTDDLGELIDSLAARNFAMQEHHYALWYDRRNDDHERVRRLDADAWPPFYELPFARSGKETAWDGLSKYDLTKYNHFCFDRLRRFAELCDQRGMVLFHNHFFQHNILEAGAHWSSSPWRSANNINNTGFPEPPPYAGDKRIFLAEQFYDVSHPTRRALYRAYIRKILDNHADQANVIHLTSGEYSGPLHFVQFWLDTIGEWQQETGRKALVGLAAPKDVQDAILADPVRVKLVSVIVIRYWWYHADGKLYAPPGGKSLSPRQFLRSNNKPSSFAQVARAVREYREKSPDKAVIFSPFEGDAFGLASATGGGSLPHIDGKLDESFAEAIARMKPLDAPEGQLSLKDDAGNCLMYSGSGGFTAPAGQYIMTLIDLTTGAVGQPRDVTAREGERLGAGDGPSLAWLKRRG